MVIPVLSVPKDPWIKPGSLLQPPEIVHERMTDRGAAVALKLVMTCGEQDGGRGAGLGDTAGMVVGAGVIADGTCVGDGDGRSVGVGLLTGESEGLRLARAWPVATGLCRDRR